MNMEFIKAKGREGTLLRPIQPLVWKVIRRYFIGIEQEVEMRFAEIAKEIETLRQPMSSNQAASANKDMMAIASRLSSLEEEIGKGAKQLDDLDASVKQIAMQSDTSVEFIKALQADVMMHNSLHRDRMSQIDERISQIAESLKDKVMAAPLQNGMEIVSRNNSSFLVLSGDLIGSELLAGLEWEPHVRECMERFADRDGVAVDAGASIGIHTVTLSRLFKKVYAFEPRLQMYRMLCANLVINNCHNVVACNQGLYDKTTSMRLMPAEKQSVPIELPDSHPDYSTPSNAAALAFGVTDQGDDGVRAVAIDSLALENVSLIKVDVQGSDAHVLRGALDTIRRCRPAVLFEWEKDLYEQRSASLDDVKDMLSGLNYKLTLLKETSPGRQADYCAEPL